MKMRQLKLVGAFFVVSLSSQAQFKLPSIKALAPAAANNAIRADVQKVIVDMPNQFSSIRGEVVSQTPQSVAYASTLLPVSAEAATITEYSSHQKPVYSWQALMLTTDDFETAAKKYKALFNQIKGTNVSFNANQSYYLQGEYEEPDESKKFFNSTFNFYTRDENIKKIKVEVNMQFEFPEWKVSVLVYERERSDDERGNIFE